MKPLLVLLALFLLVIGGRENQQRPIEYSVDRNNEFMSAMFADCKHSIQRQEMTDYNNPVTENNSSVQLQSGMYNSTQVNMSGKHFTVGAIVF